MEPTARPPPAVEPVGTSELNENLKCDEQARGGKVWRCQEPPEAVFAEARRQDRQAAPSR